MAHRPLELTKQNMKGQTESRHFTSGLTAQIAWQCFYHSLWVLIKKKKNLSVSLLILWSSTPCFLYLPCSLKPNKLRCIQVLYKKGNSSHSPARCSALAHASHLLIYSKAGALRYAQQRKLRYELMLIARERAGGGWNGNSLTQHECTLRRFRSDWGNIKGFYIWATHKSIMRL